MAVSGVGHSPANAYVPTTDVTAAAPKKKEDHGNAVGAVKPPLQSAPARGIGAQVDKTV